MTSKKRKKPKRAPTDLSTLRDALTFVVEPDEDGTRVDRFLMSRLTWRSRTSIVDLLLEDQVRRDDELIRKKSTKLKAGDRIAVAVPPPDEEIRHEELGTQLYESMLYDDEHMLALAKPPGLVMHPVGRIRVNTLIQAVHWLYGHGPLKASGLGADRIPRICHRLDKDTSGVVILAKTPVARTALQHAFDVHDLEKDYRAVVTGVVRDERGRIDLPIGPDPDAETDVAMTVRDDGFPSLTTYQVLERLEATSVVRFRIHTGRQHQIRVHARSMGHPVFLDALYTQGPYAWPDPDPVITRQALHAERLALKHPISGEPLEFVARLPDDLQRLVSGLRP